MEKTENLRSVLIFLAKLIESNQKQLAELAERVFSLQAAVRGLDPTFDDVLKEKTDDIAAALESYAQLHSEQFAQTYRRIETLEI